MLSEIALAILANSSSPLSSNDGILIGIDNDLQTSVRLRETNDAISFEVTGPNTIAPTIAVDVNRNGIVDRNLDYQVAIKPGGTPCLAYLIDESSSTTCKAIGKKAKVDQTLTDQIMVTIFSFPKQEISGDGFGFGFAVRLWSMTDRYGNVLASGDYRFGGKLSLVGDGPNFQGDSKPSGSPLLSALRGYQSCVNEAIGALEPLNHIVADQVRALPRTCAGARSIAHEQGIKVLVTTGMSLNEATQMVRGTIDDYDSDILKMAEKLENNR